VRLDVARTARVDVIVPRPADRVGTLEHDEIAHALGFQADGRSESAKPAADDRDPRGHHSMSA
jgi:hypothetical protein